MKDDFLRRKLGFGLEICDLASLLDDGSLLRKHLLVKSSCFNLKVFHSINEFCYCLVFLLEFLLHLMKMLENWSLVVGRILKTDFDIFLSRLYNLFKLIFLCLFSTATRKNFFGRYYQILLLQVTLHLIFNFFLMKLNFHFLQINFQLIFFFILLDYSF